MTKSQRKWDWWQNHSGSGID